ncbi:methyltransferase domain-containing protein [Streptomyces sp. NPDC004227]
MICFGVCVGSAEKFQRFALPGLQRICEPDSVVIERSSETSIFEAYNKVLDDARGRKDLEALVLLHEDTEIVDDGFVKKIRARLDEPDVGVIGVVGGRGVRSLSWWDYYPAGRVVETRGLIDFQDGGCDVDMVDGLIMVLSPRAVQQLRFDEQAFTGFHGYDADICFQARRAGMRVVADDLEVIHHTKGGYGDRAAFLAADRAFRAKWIAGAEQAAGTRAHRVEELGVYYEGDRPDLRALVPQTARRILDVGCGTGSLGAALKTELGAWVAGVELFPQAAEIAAGRLDELIVADLDTVSDLPDDLDAALFGDVLEHLRDPARLLSVVRRHLAPQGVIICSIPNVKHWTVLAPLLVEDRWHYEDQGLLDRTHIHFFTRHEFDQMLTATGFEPVSVACHEVPLPASLEPLVNVAVGLGADRVETHRRLSAYQYLVVARRR